MRMALFFALFSRFLYCLLFSFIKLFWCVSYSILRFSGIDRSCLYGVCLWREDSLFHDMSRQRPYIVSDNNAARVIYSWRWLHHVREGPVEAGTVCSELRFPYYLTIDPLASFSSLLLIRRISSSFLNLWPLTYAPISYIPYSFILVETYRSL